MGNTQHKGMLASHYRPRILEFEICSSEEFDALGVHPAAEEGATRSAAATSPSPSSPRVRGGGRRLLESWRVRFMVR